MLAGTTPLRMELFFWIGGDQEGRDLQGWAGASGISRTGTVGKRLVVCRPRPGVCLNEVLQPADDGLQRFHIGDLANRRSL